MNKLFKFTPIQAQEISDKVKLQYQVPNAFVFGYLDDDGSYYLEEKTKDLYLDFGIDLDVVCNDLYAMTFEQFIADKLISPYRILNQVNMCFRNLPIENVDFKRHTKANIALDKSERKFNSNGRPDYFIYTLDGVNYAKRLVEIVSNSETNFMEKRTEKLAYYREDDSLGNYFIIKDKNYILGKDTDLIMEERILSRKKIINDVKGLVVGALGLYYGATKTYDENLHEATLFFKLHADNISLFIETGVSQKQDPSDSDYLVDAISNDASTVFLDYPTNGLLGVGTEAFIIKVGIIGILDY